MTEQQFKIAISILEEQLKYLRTHVEENNIKDFVVCIGNKAFFNVK